MSDKIRLLILKVFGIITLQEEEALKKELSRNKYSSALLHALITPEEYTKRQAALKEIDPEKELKVFMDRHSKPVRRLNPVYWQAAMIIFLIGGATLSWQLFQSQPSIPLYTQQKREVQPGQQGAILILSDGTQQKLENRNYHIIETDGSQILDDSTHLNYTQVVAPQSAQPIYNHLLVGRGFEYMLTLQDGTKVWMNSESELYYPVQFNTDIRRIKLSGEAYFEVAHDTTRPFIIEVNQQFEVKVLGTCFNIKAYPSDDRAETTLVNGKVRIGEKILRPSEQAVLYKNKETEIRKVNVDYYTAWHEGWFFFDNEHLDKALEQIGRWYDVRFEFPDSLLRSIPITGKLKRFDNLNVILDMITTAAHCQFETKEKNIYVTKRK